MGAGSGYSSMFVLWILQSLEIAGGASCMAEVALRNHFSTFSFFIKIIKNTKQMFLFYMFVSPGREL